MLKNYLKPSDPLTFYSALDENTRMYYDGEAPSATNFQKFYESVLMYKQSFAEVFEFLAEGNRDVIPKINNKPYGILKLFLDKIPFGFGQRAFQKLTESRFSTFASFLEKFEVEVEQIFTLSIRNREANLLFDRLLEKPATKNDSFPKWKSEAATPRQTFNEPFRRFQKQSHIEEESETRAKCDDDVENHSDENESELEVDGSLCAVMNGDKTPNGCFKLLTFGACDKKGCSYSHDQAMLLKTIEYYRGKFDKFEQKFPPKTNSTAVESTVISNRSSIPSKIPTIMPRKTGPSNFNPRSYSNIVEEDTTENGEQQSISLLHQILFNAIGKDKLHLTSMHREGVIEIEDSKIKVNKVLFDSGALHSDYIAATFVKKHRKELEPFIYKAESIVRLGDNQTLIKIKERIKIIITFKGGNGITYSASINPCIFDTTGNDLIIGLPSIATNFAELFKDMVDVAAVNIRKSSEHLAHSELMEPWTSKPDEIAEEDEDTPLPCSFTAALHFLELSHEDAMEEFRLQFDEHIAKGFMRETNVKELLLTKGHKVFVPERWEGINGIPELELRWKDTLPDSMKPRARPVNPRLYENAKKEYERLCGYLYVPSNGPHASCLVIAPKATKPFIRFCGDYVEINKHQEIGHYPIPNVQHELEKIRRFKIFLDIDMTNSFHQIKLAELTSNRLSVQTPWGQVRPLFMPEGIGPASGILQSIVSDLFTDFQEWSIAIFDNFLLLADDYQDAYKKLEMVIDRCIQRNVYLKFSKTWLGFKEVKFFGYLCKNNSYGLTEERKQSINQIPFPSKTKEMQSFLGSALFFKSFIPNYSDKAALLNDMVKKDFSWDRSQWKNDYETAFKNMKTSILESFEIFYPNYELTWILRTDASELGVGAALFQVPEDYEGTFLLQPISFASKKFSEQAQRWSTIEQEAYGLYFGVKTFSYYLYGKPFILETDHNNLLWIEASEVPKVMRWRVYLQSFVFLLKHISGKNNIIADHLSRSFSNMFQCTYDEEEVAVLKDIAFSEEKLENCDRITILSKIHGGRMGHFGARKTWLDLNHYFPGHKIPYAVVAEFVATCPICQKDRLGMTDNIEPIVRHLRHKNQRQAIGVDRLTVTPQDKYGNNNIIVVVVHMTKLVALYPATDYTSLSLATALFQFYCTYGLYEEIYSDPGSDMTSEVLEHLHKWLGIRQVFSLVDRHESNGVEGTNKQILRHLKAIVYDERVSDKWSDPTILPLIAHIINSTVSSETGVAPFHAHFGTVESTYFNMPKTDVTQKELTLKYVKLLDDNLRIIRDISGKYQTKIVEERTKSTPQETQNMFQPGDFVLFQRNPDQLLPSKLSPKFSGPYEVIQQVKNDIECRHLVQGGTKVLHVSRVKLFHGDKEQAYKLAKIDMDQFTITDIIAYKGDPNQRMSMQFYILYEDGDKMWVRWSRELFSTIQYEEYIRKHAELTPLLHDVTVAQKFIGTLNKSDITEISPGDVVFVDIRSHGNWKWYEELHLENGDFVTYVVECKYGNWSSKKNKRKIKINYLLFKESYDVDHCFVSFYGSVKIFDSDKMVLFDEDLGKLYPKVLEK